MSGSVKTLLAEIEASGLYLKEALDFYKEKIDQLDREESLELIEQIIEEGKIFR